MENRGALLTVAIPLIVFKIWFAILLLTYAPTRDSLVWIAATHWPLIIVLGLLIGPGIASYRLLRGRARRKKLRQAEFMLNETRPRQQQHGGPGAQCSALWETISRLEGE
jgi:hypothetical protein